MYLDHLPSHKKLYKKVITFAVFSLSLLNFCTVLAADIPQIVSSTHPNGDDWYSSRNVAFSWKLSPSITSVRTLYDDIASSSPTRTFTPAIQERSFVVDEDGIYYMHVQFKDVDEWGTAAHFRFMVDTAPPTSLQVLFPNGESTHDTASPVVKITAEDSLSGISHISIAVDKDTPVIYAVSPSNLYDLPKQFSGDHVAQIVVYDKAGNIATQTLPYTVTTVTVPAITSYTKRVTSQEKFVLSGTTYPNAQVELSISDEEGIEKKKYVTSNAAGIFTYVPEKRFSSGIYEIKARVLSEGLVSDFSPSYVVIFESESFIQIGMFIMNWLSLMLVIGIALLCVTSTLWYGFVQFSRFRRKVKRTLHEAENTLKTNVAGLRRDTEEFHTILVKAEKKRELTKEESMILKKFKKRLDITEKEIEKKLEQIR